MKGSQDSEFNGWVLYDGDCGICMKLAFGWEKTLSAHGFKIAPLQEPWVKEKTNLSDKELLEDILMLKEDGTLFRGGDVYRQVMKRIWWLFPFYIVSIIPGADLVFDWTYKFVNKNRHLVSKTCRL